MSYIDFMIWLLIGAGFVVSMNSVLHLIIGRGKYGVKYQVTYLKCI